jgi:NADH-quinone oxidoreductase subunit C
MIIEHIDEQLPSAILDRHAFRGDQTLVIDRACFEDVMNLVYMEGFQLLLDITAVDWFQRDPRFDVVYHLLNLANQERLRLKVRVNDRETVPSLVSRYKAADWFEREVFDMFGIPFEGHPRLERLLMWRDFPGHPLRKDFPLDGGDSFCGDVGASFAGHAKSLND